MLHQIKILIERYFSDTSQSVADTKNGLEQLRDMITSLLETLEK